MYYNLDIATNCHLDCSYCILQCYLKKPMMTLYANLEDMAQEIENLLSLHPDHAG